MVKPFNAARGVLDYASLHPGYGPGMAALFALLRLAAVALDRTAAGQHHLRIICLGRSGHLRGQMLERVPVGGPQLGGEAVENVYTSCVFFPDEPRPEVQQFVKGYEEAYQQTPNVFAAVAYDSINLLAHAIQQAGTDRKAIRDALAQVQDFPGVTGKITFSEAGDVVKEYRKMIVKDGKFQLYGK